MLLRLCIPAQLHPARTGSAIPEKRRQRKACLGIAASLIAGSAAAAPLRAADYDSYIAGAVAAQNCGGPVLTVIEEIRLARVMRIALGTDISSMRISDSLASARALAAPDVQIQIKAFTEGVLPQLQSAIPLTK